MNVIIPGISLPVDQAKGWTARVRGIIIVG